MGGHYFSYMRDLHPPTSSPPLNTIDDEPATGWLNFNDEKVTALSEDALSKVLGVSHNCAAANTTRPTRTSPQKMSW